MEQPHSADRMCVWTQGHGPLSELQRLGEARLTGPDAPSCLCSPVTAHKFAREGKDLRKNWGELPGEACAKDSGGGTIPED